MQLKKVVTLMLAAFWLLAVNHCKLEEIPWLSFLTCCDHEESSKGPHHDDDCETDGCATVEEGLYKSEDSTPLLPAPLFVAALISPLPSLEEFNPSPGRSYLLTAASPELSRTWHFSFRAAAPPRAPSLIS